VTFTIVPFYLWVSGVDGTVGAGGFTADVDVTPIDIIENLGDFLDALDGIYAGTGEVRYGRFGAFYDVVWLDLSAIGDIDRDLIRGGVDVSFEEVVVTLAGSYRLFETSTGYLDALAGVRIWDFDVRVGLNLNVGALSDEEDETWVDPLIGAKGRFNISENVYVSGWAMIGGVVAGSDFMWDVWGNVGYQINGWLDVFAGIRATGTDYESGGFVFDATQYGPTIGATINLN